MKRRKYFVVLAVFAGTFLVSCGSENNSGSTWQAVETQEVQLQSGADEGAEELTQIGPTVMIDGVLYYDTGEEDAEGGQCGTMDGYITSSVSADRSFIVTYQYISHISPPFCPFSLSIVSILYPQ